MTITGFNNCFSKNNQSSCSGKKIDVWVKAPDFKKSLNNNIDWLVISGPQRFWGLDQKRIDASFERCNSVTDVPLYIWRDLVKILNAPPSSGIIMLYWIKIVFDGFSGVSAAGFNNNEPGVYHNIDTLHKPNPRHNWTAEKILFDSFGKEGLTVYE